MALNTNHKDALVSEFWRISLIWNKSRTEKQALTVGEAIDTLRPVVKAGGTLGAKAQKLMDAIVLRQSDDSLEGDINTQNLVALPLRVV